MLTPENPKCKRHLQSAAYQAPCRPLISADGAGVANHAGSLLIHELADRVALTSALSRGCAPAFREVRVHDPGVVLRDLAVMIADGGDCLSRLCVLRDQPRSKPPAVTSAGTDCVVPGIAH